LPVINNNLKSVSILQQRRHSANKYDQLQAMQIIMRGTARPEPIACEAVMAHYSILTGMWLIEGGNRMCSENMTRTQK
jgi:hypothetical protein